MTTSATHPQDRGPDSRTPALVCIGNVTVDVSVQPDGSAREALGGDAIFAVLAARRAGADAQWLAPLGSDLAPELLGRLAAAGLEWDHLPARDLPTVRNVVTYAADGGRHWDLVTGRDHFDRMSVYPADVPGDLLAAQGLLVLAMSVPSQAALTPWLRRHSQARIYLDLEEDGVTGNEAALRDTVACCDVFLPSEIEATRLTGIDDIAEAARRLLALGPSCVVVKRAERGCLVATGEAVVDVPTRPVEPVDPTGAGDAFCGAFAAAHLRTGDPVAAARTASDVARFAIGGFGVEALLQDAIDRRAVAVTR